MGWPRACLVSLFSGASTVAIACGLDAVGSVAPGGSGQDGSGQDGSGQDGSGQDGSGDGGVVDAQVSQPLEGGFAADAACNLAGPGQLIVSRVTAAPVVDGDLSDWSTCFTHLDSRTTGAHIRSFTDAGTFPSGDFALVHDGSSIYIAARVVGVLPLGDNGGPELYENDSIAIYIDANGSYSDLNNGYGPDATQIVIDHAGRVQGFRVTTQVATPNMNARTSALADGRSYTVEVRIDPATFGAAAFGATIGFDIAWNDGVGDSQVSEISWFKKCGASTGCGCSNGDDAPYCNSRQFGSAQLLP